MLKRTLTLILAVLMVVTMFSACGKKDGGSGSGAPAEAKEWTWPLEENKTLSVWLQWTNDFVEEPKDLYAIQQIEKNTNVSIEWTHVDGNTAQEQFGLMLASGKYPDIIRGINSYYPGGTEKGVADGVLADLTDVVEAYMPNYTKLRTSSDQLKKDTVTDDGRIVGPWTITSYFGSSNVTGERVWDGVCVREDWLKEAGMELPRTIADWETLLDAVKKNHPECEAPLMIGSNGADGLSSFLSAYGVLKEFYHEGTTVKYGPIEDGYKQWLELFHDWYSRGLIDPNFMTNGADILCPADYLGTGKAFSGLELWGLTDTVLQQQGYNTDEGFKIVATSQPVLNEGDTPQIGLDTSSLIKEQLGISKKTADLELTCRYLDYWYSDECMLLDSVGIEGESYTVDDQGVYHLTPHMQELVDAGTVNTLSEAMYMYTLGTSDFGLYNWGMFDPIYEGNPALNAYDEFDKSKFDLMMPSSMTMTDEENTEFASLYTDIQTLANENTVKFITGEKSLDEWDDHVAQLKQYGVERCIELKQAALDRYNAR
ncbi:MAG: extracellular solute-binding protein [Clostridiales bacterium]|nr:extracellular solute-binding protein [Clostridiales bacterium]